MVDLSIVIPFYNEEANVSLLFDALIPELEKLGRRYEIIAVNDGSLDNTSCRLMEIAAVHEQVVVLEFARNYGQTAAIQAGFDHSAGDIIIPMDADLQNDPRDIALLLQKLEEGYDVVSGWRKDRKDRGPRVILSRIANSLISLISGVSLRDYGCTLKAYRRSVVAGVKLYGEMHRFIPIYTTWQGAKVIEVPVRHNPRKRGVSKYGFNRIIKVLLDLCVIKFLDRYLTRPIYIFGGFGLFLFALGSLGLIWALALKFFSGLSLIQTPPAAFFGPDVLPRLHLHSHGAAGGNYNAHVF